MKFNATFHFQNGDPCIIKKIEVEYLEDSKKLETFVINSKTCNDNALRSPLSNQINQFHSKNRLNKETLKGYLKKLCENNGERLTPTDNGRAKASGAGQ